MVVNFASTRHLLRQFQINLLLIDIIGDDYRKYNKMTPQSGAFICNKFMSEDKLLLQRSIIANSLALGFLSVSGRRLLAAAQTFHHFVLGEHDITVQPLTELQDCMVAETALLCNLQQFTSKTLYSYK
ncbi:hypothetical protein D3C79_906150 [compost metagenome]